MKTEAKIQQEIFTYHWNKYPEERGRLFMIYNNPRNEINGARMKSQGMVAGVADMCYLQSNELPIFFEIKNEVGRQSKSQKEWGWMVEENNLADYYVVRSLEEVKEITGWMR